MAWYKTFHRKVKKNEKMILYVLIAFIAVSFGVTGAVLQFFSNTDRNQAMGSAFGKYISAANYSDVQARWSRISSGNQGMFNLNMIWMPAEVGDIAPFSITPEEKIAIMEKAAKALPAATPDNEKQAVKDKAYEKAFVSRLEESTWSMVILMAEAERMGLTVTDEEFSREFSSLVQFLNSYGKFMFRVQQEIHFTPEMALGLMADNNEMTPEEYAQTMKEGLLVKKYMSLVKESLTLPSDEIWKEYLRTQTSYSVQGVGYLRQDFASQVKVEDAELSKYFDDNKTKFETPAQYSMKYVFVARESFKKILKEATEEQLQQIYKETKDDYKVEAPNNPMNPGQKPDPNAPVIYKQFEEVRKEVGEAYVQRELGVFAINKIGEFNNKLNAKYDEIQNYKLSFPGGKDVPVVDIAEIAKGIEDITVGQTPFLSIANIKELEKEFGAFKSFSPNMVESLQPGDVSSQIDAENGFVVLQLTDKVPAQMPAFTEDLLDRVRSEIVKDRSCELALKASEAFKAGYDEKAKSIADKDPAGAPLPEQQVVMAKSELFKSYAKELGIETRSFFYKREDTVPNFDKEKSDEFKKLVDVMKLADTAVIASAAQEAKDKETNDIYYAIQLINTVLPSPTYEEWETKARALQTTLKNEKWKTYWKNYWAGVKEFAKIEVYEDKPQPSGLPESWD